MVACLSDFCLLCLGWCLAMLLTGLMPARLRSVRGLTGWQQMCRAVWNSPFMANRLRRSLPPVEFEPMDGSLEFQARQHRSNSPPGTQHLPFQQTQLWLWPKRLAASVVV